MRRTLELALVSGLVITLAACASPLDLVTHVVIFNGSFDATDVTVTEAYPVEFHDHDTVAYTVIEGENGQKAPNARIDAEIPPERLALPPVRGLLSTS